MPVNSTHPQFDEHLDSWSRIRDVLAGDQVIKRAGAKYVPRLDSQTDQEFDAYVQRGFFYNATARTVSGYIGMIFRKDPILEMPLESSPLHPVLTSFTNDVDLRGTTLDSYSKNIVSEVVSLGRMGTLIDWHGEPENRAYLSMYPAEAILNWRQIRVEGHLRLSLVVLAESVAGLPNEEDPFVVEQVQQLRVLKLIVGELMVDGAEGGKGSQLTYQVEIWQLLLSPNGKREKEWQLVQSLTPMRLGKSLSCIPFVFHGPSHSRPDVEKSPIEDIVSANLDHYRLNTDYKHGMHFTALPTAFVAGFDKNAQLRIGSSTAWVTETLGATAGYLEFKGRALDRTERLLAILGSRLLEGQKRAAESAKALSIRQAGEGSIIAGIATSVTASMNEVLRWIYWWHSTVEKPDEVTLQDVRYELNSDFEAASMGAPEIQALVAAWQAGAISRDTLLHNLRTGEVLPPGRTNQEEVELIIETQNANPIQS